jgi:ATP-binding cassette subfamily C (CFTR/MRP) protein 1
MLIRFVLNGDGRIVERGSYNELVAASGYVRSLANKPQVVNAIKTPEVILDDETLHELGLDSEEQQDASRQTGDMTVYLYYFQNVGWLLLGLYLSSCLMFSFGLVFPRKWSLPVYVKL